ncbi:hypothetical protein SSX86_006537 [Deinandra increscens subsp. villosa]|uniref:Replication factor A C-terminal domain-containing protein n=1 Tax=Deinandra increscens subsp. villosa TaxID=3103831 RepID=A0AAP0DMX3_9ASTR
MQKQSLLLTDKLQLESTSATTVEIEPPVEDYKESMQKLKRMPKARTIIYGQQTDKDIRDNITTLQSVVSMNPDSIDNYRFACKAAVKEFHGYRKWYRRKCPNSDCDDTLRPEEDYLLCKHCGRIDNPVYTIESTSSMMKRKDYNLMKISAIDLSGQVIEITLWEDIGYTYVNSLTPGMVIAITSLIVTTHADKLQLESTSATTVEIEPPVEDYKESMQKLKRMPKARTIVYGQQTDKDIRDNITTLQSVVSMNPDSIDNYRFACKAAVKEFHGYRKWYRRKCPNSDCDDTLRPEEDYLLCKHCGRIDNPVYTIESTSSMMKRKDYNLMKISAIDLSGQVIEITLWEDIGYTYVNSLTPGMVIAITSLIVTTHADKLQLESTSATTVEIEPPVEDYKESMQKLKRMPKARTIVYGQQTDKDRDNITTLQSVVSMNPDSIDNYRFACKAAVKEFHGYRKWYRRKCPNSDCNDTLRPEEDYLLCKHCGRIDNPFYTYCVNGTLDDGTATLAVVFFDDAMTQAIGIDCETMVLKNGYEDPKVIPNPILSLAGQEKIYSFSMHKNKDASIQKTLEVGSARLIATAPATPAAKISRKQPRDDPGTQESSTQEYSRKKKAKNAISE